MGDASAAFDSARSDPKIDSELHFQYLGVVEDNGNMLRHFRAWYSDDFQRAAAGTSQRTMDYWDSASTMEAARIMYDREVVIFQSVDAVSESAVESEVNRLGGFGCKEGEREDEEAELVPRMTKFGDLSPEDAAYYIGDGSLVHPVEFVSYLSSVRDQLSVPDACYEKCKHQMDQLRLSKEMCDGSLAIALECMKESSDVECRRSDFVNHHAGDCLGNTANSTSGRELLEDDAEHEMLFNETMLATQRKLGSEEATWDEELWDEIEEQAKELNIQVYAREGYDYLKDEAVKYITTTKDVWKVIKDDVNRRAKKIWNSVKSWFESWFEDALEKALKEIDSAIFALKEFNWRKDAEKLINPKEFEYNLAKLAYTSAAIRQKYLNYNKFRAVLDKFKIGVKCRSKMGVPYRLPGSDVTCSQFKVKKFGFKLKFTWGKVGGNFALAIEAFACVPLAWAFGIPVKPFYAKMCVGGEIRLEQVGGCPQYIFSMKGKVYINLKLGIDVGFFACDFVKFEIGVKTDSKWTKKRYNELCWWRSGQGAPRRRWWRRRRNTRHCNYRWQKICDVYVKGYAVIDATVARAGVEVTYWVKSKKLVGSIFADRWVFMSAEWSELAGLTLFTFWM